MAYLRLTDSDRETIMAMIAQEKGAIEIAAALGRDVSTIIWEVYRHLCSNGMYSAISAQRQADMTARLHHTQRKLDDLHIPVLSDHRFRRYPTTDSGLIRPLILALSVHKFRSIPIDYNGALFREAQTIAFQVRISYNHWKQTEPKWNNQLKTHRKWCLRC
ncbi:MAG: helix-turn-helix domain-containing protein [Bacteroidota bacterium]|jgi:hypothetical protein